MEFSRSDCKFTIPDRPTARQQMAWYNAHAGRDKHQQIARNWEAAKELIQTWDCEKLPVLEKVDLDAITQPSHVDILIWAGSEVYRFMNELEDIPKN